MQLTISFIALASLLTVVNAASYTRTDKVVGPAFNEWFAYQAMPDPTKGRVNYVNKATAQAQNLTFASADTFILRADSKKVVPAGSLGRDSVRMRSFKSYTIHVVTMDIRHMPQGCGHVFSPSRSLVA
ncbi:hypothetical protein BDV98DRAFT_596542 [Pterulicium gracile]|uniref:Uncharacterized protein n=1 Tax=Pterulicium gracile TaxID=1884261 RepID=A0A5C3Q654_9AGAR|nr:hypothetical protein BDV98DRAFT_596542 [Pterula gracilis]